MQDEDYHDQHRDEDRRCNHCSDDGNVNDARQYSRQIIHCMISRLDPDSALNDTSFALDP